MSGVDQIKVVDEQQLAEIRATVDAETAKFIKGLPKLIKQRLEEAVCRIAGFEKDSWGGSKWKVDHCNGRKSTISEFLHDEAERAIRKCVGKIGADFVIDDEMQQELQKEFYSDVFRKVKSGLRDRAHSVANSMLDQMVGGIVADPTPLLRTLEAAQDPDFGDTPLEKMVLDEIAKQQAAKEAAAAKED